MDYKALYNARQKEAEKVPREWYVDQLKGLPWVNDISIKIEDSLKKSVLTGFVYRSGLISHGGLEYYDYNVILAGDLLEPQERFVAIKEIMHGYFDPEDVSYATDSAVALENHMSQMFDEYGSGKRSKHVQADGMALWMALGVICPAHIREKYLMDKTPPEQVAEILNIPLKQAQNLLSDRFDAEISQILN
ncbi:hypothetical protein [Sphingorhabdus lacus]|uniref:ImmA/IrrE family metallo-endopeptidase n=1 Tax=Sphingorhabdus lacus TaxID=392610 RepID=A0A6I6L8H9_9SPHN|nr:hypothetical protein [Sphingorhabdus lacus]QGY80808.1 hypothetical protein EUU25_09360 [Sphingorhabdus lacus]